MSPLRHHCESGVGLRLHTGAAAIEERAAALLWSMVDVDVYCGHVSALADLLLSGGKRRAHERA
jgi:hypothetical protein